MAKYYKIIVDSNEFVEGDRILNYEAEWEYNRPTKVTCELLNDDGALSPGGSMEIERGDVFELHLIAVKDISLTRYFYGAVVDLENTDNKTIVITAKDVLHEGEQQFFTNIFFENYLDHQYAEIVRATPKYVELSDITGFGASDEVIEPPIRISYLDTPSVKNLTGAGFWNTIDTKTYAQKFKASTDKIFRVWTALKSVLEADHDNYEVGICPPDSNGDPDPANFIARKIWGSAVMDTVGTATTWISWPMDANLSPGNHYYVYIKKNTASWPADDIEIGRSVADGGGGYFEDDSGWTELTGFGMTVIAHKNGEEAWRELEFGSEFRITNTGGRITFDRELDPLIQANANPSRPELIRVSTYFKDETTAANILNANDLVVELIEMGWKDITQSIAANFDSDGNYRMIFYNLDGSISILDALIEVGQFTKELTGGREGQVYSKYVSAEEVHFKEAATISDSAVRGFNEDNPWKAADGTKNAEAPFGQIIRLEIEKISVDKFSGVRVEPKDFQDIAEVNVYGGFPDYKKTFLENDQSLLDYRNTRTRAEEIADTLSNDDWEGEMEVIGYFPAFSGGRDFACGDIINIKSTQKGFSTPQKFKIEGVRITHERKTEFRLTRAGRLRDLLMSNSERLTKVQRLSSPTEFQDIILNIRSNISDPLVGASPYFMDLQTGSSSSIQKVEVVKDSSSGSGHNIYHGYLYPTWETDGSGSNATKIILSDSAPNTLQFDLADLTEFMYIPFIFKYGPIRIVINWDVGTS